MGSEDQALTLQSRRIDHHKGKHPHPRSSNKKLPKFKCYTCDEIGHYARNCPKNKNGSHKKKGNKKNIMLTLQRMLILLRKEPNKKVMILQVMKNMF